jgi:pyridoxine 5-phosphate synthase
MPIRLHINIDHVATVRNARGTAYPDPVSAASLCELAGADGITCHLREDRRHIVDDDVVRLRRSVTTMLNLEMAATDAMLAFALGVGPDVVTLVPERREERTTEGGLDAAGRRREIEAVVQALRQKGIKVSLFLAPDAAQIDAAKAMGVDQIELHTGEYCHATGGAREAELARLREAAVRVRGAGIALAAGHGLTRANVRPIVGLPGLEELNIGHAIVAEAIFLGLDRAVRGMREAMTRGVLASRGPGAGGERGSE